MAEGNGDVQGAADANTLRPQAISTEDIREFIRGAPDRAEEAVAAIVEAAPDQKVKDIAIGMMKAAPDEKVKDIAAAMMEAAPDDKIEDFTEGMVEAAPDDKVEDIAATMVKASPNTVKHDVATGMLRTLPPIKEFADYQLVAARPEDVQLIAQAQVKNLEQYYNTALAQSKESFKWALIAAGVGSAFFLLAVAVMLVAQSPTVATISVVSGAVVQVISGLNFYLYSRTNSQLLDFSVRMDQTQRFLLANSICESLADSKEQTRASLVNTIATLLPGPSSRSGKV